MSDSTTAPMSPEQIAKILGDHGKWIRGEVDGVRANLAGANLYRANLDGASLYRANLYRANLAGASLAGANLYRANLAGANLAGANLDGANLDGAKIERTTNLTGEPWSEYLATVVPALLTAGGKTIDAIVAAGAWDCHSWDNCPMAFAFGINSSDKAPLLLRPRVEQFITLFDAKLIPCPTIPASESIA